MATIEKKSLAPGGSSVNCQGIKVAATSTTGTAIHQACSGTTDFDEVWLWACNTDSQARLLTIEFGGTTSPDDLIQVTVAANSTELVVPGLIMQNGAAINAFAAAANVIIIHGYVNHLNY